MERNFPRNFLILLLWFGIKSTAYLVLGQTAETSGTICLPPAFTNTAPPSIIYTNQQQTVVLPCSAVGTPTPTYAWTKNGVSLTIDNSHITQSQGSISIQSPSSSDQGMYQCIAYNQWGTAVSNNTFLQMAYLNTFPTTNNPAGMSGNVGAPLQLSCSGKPSSIPNATYSWIYTPSMTSSTTYPVTTSNRISVDRASGNLYIANLLSTDATTAGSNNAYYGCCVYNSYVQTTYSGSFTTLNVFTTNPVVQTVPASAYQTSSPVKALLGSTINLSCFFNGYPTPTISWSPTSGSFPSGRYSITNNNTTLTITGLQSTDPPGYTCTGTNWNGQASNTITLQFGAAPVFLTSSDSPHNINATDGDTVTFVCSASANPSTSITWYRNYAAINQGNVNSRTTFSNDLTKVTITDVCKDCSDGSSDLAVYQCNATNTYGYAFAQGYLNVLLNTSIVSGPESVSLVVGGTITFSCSATSDPSTPVQISWEFDGSPLNPSAGRYTMSSGSLTISDAQTSDEGTYTCVATNGYSTDSATADLLAPAAPVVPTSSVSPTVPVVPTSSVSPTVPVVPTSSDSPTVPVVPTSSDSPTVPVVPTSSDSPHNINLCRWGNSRLRLQRFRHSLFKHSLDTTTTTIDPHSMREKISVLRP